MTIPIPGPFAAHPHTRQRVGLGAMLLLLALGACAPPPPAGLEPDAVKRVRILHVNDFHGRIHPFAPVTDPDRQLGGAPVLAAHFDSARARFDGPTFLLSGGDMFQGSAISNFSWGRATVDMMNLKRFDAAALGNHEFDWGIDTLRARVRESRFPWLAANVFVEGTDRHPDWLQPWVMLEQDGARLAVIGLALPYTPEVTVAGRTAGLEFRPAPAYVNRYARAAREAGADFVVVAAHIGVRCEEQGIEGDPRAETERCRGDLMEIAESLTERIDLMVGGHDHQRTLITHAGVPISQAYYYGMFYGVADLERRGDSVRVLNRWVGPSVPDAVDADTLVARRVAYWDREVEPLIGRRVTEFAQPMDRRGHEYPLGNLLADAHRLATGAHVSLVNNGSIRRALPAGPATLGVLFELQPFQNEMVVVEVTARTLRQALEHAIGDATRFRAHISGMTAIYDPRAPEGQRIRQIRLDDGRVLRDDDRLNLATTEFVAAGGDRFTMLTEGRSTRTGMLDLDVLVSHLQSLPQPVQPPPVGRWRVVD
jgi:2',3'-cyclic-nucleotide 2'-phosphodiesterase (5'-nucleotidase family)